MTDISDPPSPPSRHQRRSEATRARILEAAHRHFVAVGLDGARMETIAAEAGVNKALVYRHFGGREQLYREVLRRAYEKVRQAEVELSLPEDPVEALDRLVAFTFQYYIDNPDFLILVGIENLNGGAHLRRVGQEGLHVSSLLDILRRILDAGVARGIFREGLDPMEFYMVVASQCWFTVATSHTFGITFDVDVLSPGSIARRRALICDNVRRYALRDPDRWNAGAGDAPSA
ncbi:TetR/AcrR family transcriptional regulator [Amaricoccus solimangrovi]|uniref:TetR/AcrR family transcriptional regulator n=1 Tax=Amaricoccus solimangrovi TaxID=2589815 RepID=A0A501WNV9_9RHOB|nr:TetR/AcrR family transcriptional regulator [Amaricoccus solimangrovi]TPE48967.1 TetR/AcrR family transcriptional regulator [Amaricoccus solimangrovi]